nr:methyl-accepting chemotaxis protein [Chromobacterium sp. ATCC 53434]
MTQFLSQFSIRLKIFGLIFLGIAAALIIGLNGIFGASSMFQLTTDMHDNMLQPVHWLGQAAKQAAYVSRSDYRFIAESEKSQMDQVQANRDKFEAKMKGFLDQYRKTELTPPEVEALKRFDAAWEAMEAPCKQVRDLSYTDTGNGENNKKALVIMAKQCRPLFTAVDDILTELSDINTKLADKALVDAQGQYQHVRNIAIVVLAIGLVLLLGLGLAIQGGIVGSLRIAGAAMEKIGGGDLTGEIRPQGRDEVADMMRSLADTQQRLRGTVGEIVRSAASVAATSEELAASTEEVSASIGQQVNATSSAAASIEELTVSIDLCASNATQANEQAAEAGQQAKAGNKDVQDSTVRVKRVNESVASSADSLESLSDQAQQIGSIATVIKDVADQTNLLALNAAIEAARGRRTGPRLRRRRRRGQEAGRAHHQLGAGNHQYDRQDPGRRARGGGRHAQQPRDRRRRGGGGRERVGHHQHGGRARRRRGIGDQRNRNGGRRTAPGQHRAGRQGRGHRPDVQGERHRGRRVLAGHARVGDGGRAAAADHAGFQAGVARLATGMEPGFIGVRSLQLVSMFCGGGGRRTRHRPSL